VGIALAASHCVADASVPYSVNEQKRTGKVKLVATVQPAEQVRRRPWTGVPGYFDTIPLCGLALLLAAVRVILILPSHFWLDETMTFWHTGGGMAQLVARCTQFPLSILYGVLILAIRSLGARAEWAFRLPSVIAVGVAAFVLFRMARSLWGNTAAWLSLAMFVSLPGVSSAARSARPYGFGLLLVVLATWLLWKLLEKPSFALALGYGATAGLTVHFHLLFGSAVTAHAIYFCYWLWRGHRIPPKLVATAAATMALVVSPLLPIAYSVSKDSALHSFASLPAPEAVLAAFFPVPLMLCLLIGVALAVFNAVELKSQPEAGSDAVILAALLGTIPILVAAAISWVSKTSLWVVRYYLPYAVGQALCFGAFASTIVPRAAAQWMALSMVALNFFILTHSPARQTVGAGDWAAGLAYVDRDTANDKAPVLIRSQYPESDGLPVNPIADNPSFSQLSYYPSNSRLIPMRLNFNDAQAAEIDGLLKGPLRDARRILVLSVDGPTPLAPLLWYLAGRLGPATRVRQVADFDTLNVIELTREGR
jgi:hypothetical protein